MKKMAQAKINCCETCRIYWTCETKWYRGEKGEENICCPICNYYTACLEKALNRNKGCGAKQK
jgi:hypothetical protein